MRRLATFFYLVLSGTALAHPTSYQGALGVMTWNQPYLSDYWVTYSFRHDMAVAARYMQMQMDDGKLQVYMPQYDVLLKRWNGKDYQANIYGYGGYGGAEMNGERGTAYLGGVEADAESRSLFIMGKGEWMRPIRNTNPDSRENVMQKFDLYEFKLGAAPYEAEFNELASWMMVQYQYHPALVKKQAITPMVRFFYKNVLWETGVSLDGDYMLNLMFHF